jgi:hypothetical protein
LQSGQAREAWDHPGEVIVAPEESRQSAQRRQKVERAADIVVAEVEPLQ